MAWQIEIGEGAKKDLSKLDKQIAKRITTFVRERLTPLENPRSLGEAFQGAAFGQYWKYRVGDYRLICLIQDQVMLVTVVKVGHRRDVYRAP